MAHFMVGEQERCVFCDAEPDACGLLPLFCADARSRRRQAWAMLIHAVRGA